MPGGEGVLEINDGEDEAEELPERHHQRDRQWGALGGQDENTTDANIPEETVKDCNKTWDTEDKNLISSRVAKTVCVNWPRKLNRHLINVIFHDQHHWTDQAGINQLILWSRV